MIHDSDCRFHLWRQSAYNYVPWLRLSQEAVLAVGAPAQTLAGIMQLTGCAERDMFRKRDAIAKAAGLSKWTVDNHTTILSIDSKWIVNHGRQPSFGGNKRRTVTYRPTPLAIKSSRDFLPLPIWAWDLRSWAKRCLAAVIFQRVMWMYAAIEMRSSGSRDEKWKQIHIGDDLWLRDDDDKWVFDDNLSDKFRISNAKLEAITGLGKKALIDAKRSMDGICYKMDEWSDTTLFVPLRENPLVIEWIPQPKN